VVHLKQQQGGGKRSRCPAKYKRGKEGKETRGKNRVAKNEMSKEEKRHKFFRMVGPQRFVRKKRPKKNLGKGKNKQPGVVHRGGKKTGSKKNLSGKQSSKNLWNFLKVLRV